MEPQGPFPKCSTTSSGPAGKVGREEGPPAKKVGVSPGYQCRSGGPSDTVPFPSVHESKYQPSLT